MSKLQWLRAASALSLRRMAGQLAPDAALAVELSAGQGRPSDGMDDDARHFVEIGDWIAKAPEYRRALLDDELRANPNSWDNLQPPQ